MSTDEPDTTLPDFAKMIAENRDAFTRDLAKYYIVVGELLAASGVNPAAVAREMHVASLNLMARAFGRKAAGRMLQKSASLLRRDERNDPNKPGTH
jgi:hypothetical protein